jgi:hypothetical protein
MCGRSQRAPDEELVDAVERERGAAGQDPAG